MGSDRSDHDIVTASSERAYVGGSYYNPPKEVMVHCRQIVVPEAATASAMNLGDKDDPTFVVSSLYGVLISNLMEGELLFAVYSRGEVLMAPYIVDEERCADFESQVCRGTLERRGFFAVPRSKAEEGLLRDFG
jgi:hypothetical protein